MKNNKNKQDEVMVIDFNHDREAILHGESWVYTDSLNVAKTIGKEHKEVMRKTRKICEDYGLQTDFLTGEKTPPVDETTEFIGENTEFKYSVCYYKDKKGEYREYYKLSKDLLVLVIFSFKTEEARTFHKLYIAKFNQMERELQWYKSRYLGIVTRNSITDAIKEDYKHEYNGHNIYVDFTDLVYTTLYDMKAWQIRQLNKDKFPLNKQGKPSGNIRPYLSDEDIEKVDKLEKEICVLIKYGFQYEQIKELLEKRFTDKHELILLSEPR